MKVIDFHIHYIRREMLNATWLDYLEEINPELEKNADKVIFGSDWPTMPADIEDNISAIQSLPIKESAVESILYNNARKIIKQIKAGE